MSAALVFVVCAQLVQALQARGTIKFIEVRHVVQFVKQFSYQVFCCYVVPFKSCNHYACSYVVCDSKIYVYYMTVLCNHSKFINLLNASICFLLRYLNYSNRTHSALCSLCMVCVLLEWLGKSWMKYLLQNIYVFLCNCGKAIDTHWLSFSKIMRHKG